ncbi:hypothetical protein M0R04_07760 [Candidatus Dojkabacteria bacterium]|jgi:hypothetical protein|nr:hypothetical protein [Candidatus Dojkabacteria bacterium]
MKLYEIASKKGTYAAVRFSDETNKAILKYIKDNKIPNGLKTKDLHTTLLYSRKFLPDYKPGGKYEKPMVGIPTEFDVWESNNEDGNNTNCLVIKYKCPELTKHHKQLMKDHKATFDYPDYNCHVTLSYDIKDTDIKKLPKFKDIVPTINIISEYGEDLNLSWSQTKK